MPRRGALFSIAAMLFAVLASVPAGAQDYPARPIRVLVTSGAGGLMDVMTRLVAQDLGAKLGQSIVIDNRPGGMTQIGADALVRAPPDGYTLMIATSEVAMLPFLKKSYRYDPVKDFTPIALVVTSWTVFAVNPNVPAQTLPELIAYAKANPGKLRYGSGGVGGALHIAVEMLKLADRHRHRARALSRRRAGRRPTRSPGRSTWCRWGSPATRVAEGGKLRILAQTGPCRHPMFPDVPTTAELGLPEVRMETWFGLTAPPGTAGADRRAPRARDRDGGARSQAWRTSSSKIGCAVRLHAAIRVHGLHGQGRQEVAAVDSRDGHPGDRLSKRSRRLAVQVDATTWSEQMAKMVTWPNGKKVAVSVTVMFETWAEGKAPNYSVQTTHLKAGTVDHASKAWSTYGGRVGVWRIINMLDRLQIPGTFFTNARCAEEYPDAVKQIVKSGHDLGGHAYTQDQLLAYMSLDEQQATIRKSIDLLEACGGKKVTGWGSPVVAFTPETAGFLAKAGLTLTTDVTYADLPIKIRHRARRDRRRADHRLLRQPGDAGEPARSLRRPQGHLRLPGRERADGAARAGAALPVRRPAADHLGDPGAAEIHGEVAPTSGSPRHAELARWALAADVDEHSYRSRFFATKPAPRAKARSRK